MDLTYCFNCGSPGFTESFFFSLDNLKYILILFIVALLFYSGFVEVLRLMFLSKSGKF